MTRGCSFLVTGMVLLIASLLYQILCDSRIVILQILTNPPDNSAAKHSYYFKKMSAYSYHVWTCQKRDSADGSAPEVGHCWSQTILVGWLGLDKTK